MEDNIGSVGEAVTFMGLPEEVRPLIYKKLELRDILQMRKVSREIKQEIDDCTEFDIRIDQVFRGFRKLLRLKVKSCKITNLTHQHIQGGTLFAFPTKLKRLTLDGRISQLNLLKILKPCQNIEELTVTHETLGIVNLFRQKNIEKCLQTNLCNVTHLNLQLLQYPLGDPSESENNANMIILLDTYFPQLKSFKLYFSLWGCYYKLFLFLQKHAASLETIELQVGDRGDIRNLRNSGMFFQSNLRYVLDMTLLKSLNLKMFNFRDDVLNVNQVATGIIMEILEMQKRLTVLQFHSPGDLGIRDLGIIVTNNENTIREVVVYNLKNPSVQPLHAVPLVQNVAPALLDASMFQRCMNLRTLALSSPTRIDEGVEVANIRLINLHLLPPSIERLHLTGFHMNLQEIVLFSQSSVNLKEVLLADAGVLNYSSLLSCFLKNCAQLEYLYVRPVVTRANGDDAWYAEVDKLSQLYSRFMGISFDPFDDLDGFEAKITESDKIWLRENIHPLEDYTV